MKYPYALLAGLLGALVMALPAAAVEKKVVGWIEKVRIYPGNFVVHAKLDSGAEYCSLDAANLKEFDRNGKRWVRFDLSRTRWQEDYHRAAPVAHGPRSSGITMNPSSVRSSSWGFAWATSIRKPKSIW